MYRESSRHARFRVSFIRGIGCQKRSFELLKDRQARGVVHPNKGKSKSVEAIAKRTATRLQNKLAKTKGA